jgi:hypothetical protein
MANIKRISSGLYRELTYDLENFEEDVETDVENGSFYKTDYSTMIDLFRDDYHSTAVNYLYDNDIRAFVNAIKSYPIDSICNLYYKNQSQDEFDDIALLNALGDLILDDFIKENRDKFEELADYMNGLNDLQKKTPLRPQADYESLKRRKNRR